MFSMRTCQSCGKANNPIRKYCTRCGKSLLQAKEEKPAPVPTSVVTETPIPDVQAPTDQYTRSDQVEATTDDEWVRPSQVSRDRVRSGSATKPKSEMEKAREAFARAEGVGIDEADGSGIVETRMLRASEVRELMGDGATITDPTPPPARTVPSGASAPPPTAPPVASTPIPTQPPTTPSPAAAPPETSPSPPTEPATQPPAQSAATPAPAANAPAPAATHVPPAATPKPAAPTPAAPSIPVKPPTPAPTPAPVATAPSSVSIDTKVPEIEEILSRVTEPEDLQDSKVKDLVGNLTTLHTELRTVKEDLANVAGRLDEFVRSCQNDAEVKRIHYESLVEQERFAKQEYESAKKEFDRVDKRRKKEVSNLENKVLKVDNDGYLIWDKFLNVGARGVYLARANPIDGGVYAGCSREPCNIFRLDKDGNIIWQKTNFPSIWTYGTGVSTIDGSLYIGSGWPHWLAKINMDGSVQWKIGPTCDYIPSIAVDIEDNVYVGGQRDCQNIRKHNGSNGDLLWSKKIGPDSWEGRYGITPVFTGMPSFVDTTPPTLEPEANQTILWPPNHRMVDIVINANASDNSGLPVTLTASVSSNEPEDGTGAGDKAPDMTVPIIDQETGTITLQVRAERSGTGDGREYIISITAVDSSGNSSTANLVIIVPHNKKKK